MSGSILSMLESHNAHARTQQKLEEELVAYVHKMKKSELQESLLRLLYEGPEWQYDRFIRDNIR